MKGSSPTLLSQVLAVAAALGGSNPEPQSLVTIVVKWMLLRNKRCRPREKVSAPCQGDEGRPNARQRVVLPHLTLDPAWAFPTSLGTWEAGLCVLSLSGDQEPTDHPPSPKRQQQPPRGRQGCPRVMLETWLLEIHTETPWWDLGPSATDISGPSTPIPSRTTGREPTSFPLRKVFCLPV